MPSDRAAITEALESLKGTPALQVNHAKLANRLLLRDQIDRVELSLNLFGRGRLRVVHRIPVARLAGPEPGMALSREGVVFRSDAVMDDLPLLTPPASAWKFGASVADSWECLAAASLAESVRGTLPPEPWRIQVDQRSTVSLSLPGKAVVRLGSTSDMDAKLRAFLDALNANPELMQKAREINFSAPSNPVYIP